MIGGHYVNRFAIDGRAYKVIAQVERAGRLTPDDLQLSTSPAEWTANAFGRGGRDSSGN